MVQFCFSGNGYSMTVMVVVVWLMVVQLLNVYEEGFVVWNGSLVACNMIRKSVKVRQNR